MDLQIQAVLHLLKVGSGPLLLGKPEDENQIRNAAYKGHELHHRRGTAGEKICIDPRQIVEGIVHSRDDAELALNRCRILGDGAHGGRGPQQKQKQRHGQRQLHGLLHGVSAGAELHDEQRQPAAELTAEIRGQHGDNGPEPLPAQQAQNENQGKVGVQGIKILSQLRRDSKINNGLQQKNTQREQSHFQYFAPGPCNIAESGGEHNAEQAHRHGVADIEGRHVKNTCFLRKAYSR